MNLVCVICSESLSHSDEVCSTSCGHIFHYDCLTNWLDRSRTCPQCRKKTTDYQIHRLYLNFTDDTYSLLDKIDNLKHQLNLRDKDNKHYLEENDILQKRNANLRKHVKKLENELYEMERTISAFQEHTNYYQLEAMFQSMTREIEGTFNNVLYQLRGLRL